MRQSKRIVRLPESLILESKVVVLPLKRLDLSSDCFASLLTLLCIVTAVKRSDAALAADGSSLVTLEEKVSPQLSPR